MNVYWETRHKHDIVFKYNNIKRCRSVFFGRTLLCQFLSSCLCLPLPATAPWISEAPPTIFFLFWCSPLLQPTKAVSAVPPHSKTSADHILNNFPCWWRVRRYEHLCHLHFLLDRPAWFSSIFFLFSLIIRVIHLSCIQACLFSSSFQVSSRVIITCLFIPRTVFSKEQHLQVLFNSHLINYCFYRSHFWLS